MVDLCWQLQEDSAQKVLLHDLHSPSHPSHPTPAQLSTLDRFLNGLRGNAVGQLQHFCSREKSTLYIVLYFSLLAPPVFPPNFDTVKNQTCAQILDGTFSLAPQSLPDLSHWEHFPSIVVNRSVVDGGQFNHKRWSWTPSIVRGENLIWNGWKDFSLQIFFSGNLACLTKCLAGKMGIYGLTKWVSLVIYPDTHSI